MVLIINHAIMKLDDFIKEVIVSIHNGIDAAKEELKSDVVPQDVDIVSNLSTVGKRISTGGITSKIITDIVSEVRFNVSLTDEIKDGSTKGIGVAFAGISIGGKGDHDTTNKSLTSVEFTIPIFLKHQQKG